MCVERVLNVNLKERRTAMETVTEASTWPYLIYAVVAVGLTVGLAMTLHRHGRTFLNELFPDQPDIARGLNSLLVTGFFMCNLGYGFLISRTEPGATQFEATESLIQKLGVLLLSLGCIHFVNMAVLWRIRRNMTETVNVPMPATTMVMPPPPMGEPTLNPVAWSG